MSLSLCSEKNKWSYWGWQGSSRAIKAVILVQTAGSVRLWIPLCLCMWVCSGTGCSALIIIAPYAWHTYRDGLSSQTWKKRKVKKKNMQLTATEKKCFFYRSSLSLRVAELQGQEKKNGTMKCADNSVHGWKILQLEISSKTKYHYPRLCLSIIYLLTWDKPGN